MKSFFKQFFKITAIGVLVLLLLLVALRLPVVQTLLAKQAVSILSNQLETTISIDKLGVNFFDQVSLEGLYLEDQKKDTLVYLGKLEVDIAIFKLLQKEIKIEKVSLNNANFQIEQEADSSFNFSFILDAFQSEEQTQSKTPFDFSLRQVHLENLNGNLNLLSNKHVIELGQLELRIKDLDLNTLFFDITSIKIENSKIANWVQAVEHEKNGNLKLMADENSKINFPFYNLPVWVICRQIDFKNIDYAFQVGEEQVGEMFSSSSFKIQNGDLHIKDIIVNKKRLSASLDEGFLRLNENQQVKDLNLRTFWTNDSLYVQSRPWNFNESYVHLNFESKYKTFNDLIHLASSTSMHVKTHQTKLWIKDLNYFIPSLKEVSFLTKLQDNYIELTSDIYGKLSDINVNNLRLDLLNSSLDLNGQIDLSEGVSNFVLTDVTIQARSPIQDLQVILGKEYVLDRYKGFKEIMLNTELGGSLETLQVNHLDLQTGTNTKAKFSGLLTSLNNMESIHYDVLIDKVETSYQDLLRVSPEIPAFLSTLSQIKYNGNLSGDQSTFDVDGRLTTNLGQLRMDLKADFTDNYGNASYAGNLESNEFDLGAFLANDSLGLVSLNADFSGEGLSINTMHTSAKLVVGRFDFNSYTYHDILVDGRIDEMQFEGSAKIEDEHVDFKFDGLINFEDSLPTFNFTADLSKFHAQQLNLTSFPLSVEMKIESALSGKNINDLDGDLVIKNLTLQNKDKVWREDSIVLHAENKAGLEREINLKAKFLDFELKGKYSLLDIPTMLLAFGDQHFPLSALIGKKGTNDAFTDSTLNELKDETLDVHLKVTKLDEISALFNIELQRLDSIKLDFSLDAPKKLLDFKFYIPQIYYQDIQMDSIYLSAETKEGDLESLLKIGFLSYGELFYLPGAKLKSQFENKEALLRVILNGDTGKRSLDLSTRIYKEEQVYKAEVLAPTILNNQVWKIEQDGKFEWYQDSLYLPLLKFYRGTQLVELLAKDRIKLKFENFGLNNLAELVQMDSLHLNGNINGDFSIDPFARYTPFIGNLEILNIQINQNQVGNLSLEASNTEDQIEAKLKLVGLDNRVNANAKYNLSSKDLAGQVILEKLVLARFAPFLDHYLLNLQGYLQGAITIAGSIDQPTIDGGIRFNDVKAKVVELGTQYGIQSGSARVTESKITPDLVLLDEDNRMAKLSGEVTHDLFSKFLFDLKLSTDKFTFLNSKKDPEALFYGKVIGAIDISVNGDLATPIITGKVTALKESDITVQLLSPKAIASQESYVVFVNGNSYNQADLDSVANERYSVSSSWDIDLDVTIDEKTKLQVIIDPLTGDKLSLQGSGRLSLRIPPKGEMNVIGTYTVTQGKYNFSFQKVLKREFEIVQGSQIGFSGNPLMAQLDIRAAYNTQASVYGLVQGQSSSISEDEARNLKKKEDVRILLDIEGVLSEPELNFDIKLMNEGNSPIGNSAKQALDQIKLDQSELNKQVFSLLLFNNFTGSSSSGNISSTGTATAVRSVGNLVNNQLNKLASKAEGFQINFDIDQYQNQFSETDRQITEVDLGVSQSLLNDRLNLSLGGNVDFETGNQEQGVLGNLAGDFVLEYSLTEDGNYRIKVFQKSDYDALNEENLWKTGVGFSYQTNFGKLINKNRKDK